MLSRPAARPSLRRAPSLFASTRGAAGQEYVMAALCIGLSGVLGMQTLGGSMNHAIAGEAGSAAATHSFSPVAVSRMAGSDTNAVDTADVNVSDFSDEQIVLSVDRTVEALGKAVSDKDRENLEAGLLVLRQEQTRRAFADKTDSELADLKKDIAKNLALRTRDMALCVANPDKCPNDVAFARAVNQGISIEQGRRANVAKDGDNTTGGNGTFIPSTPTTPAQDAAEEAVSGEGTLSGGRSITEGRRQDPIRPSDLVSPEDAKASASMGEAIVEGGKGGAIGLVDFVIDGVKGMFTPVKWLLWDTWHGADIGGDLKRFAVGVLSSPKDIFIGIRDNGYACLVGDEAPEARGEACAQIIGTGLLIGGGKWKGPGAAKALRELAAFEKLASKLGVTARLGKAGEKISVWWKARQAAKLAAKDGVALGDDAAAAAAAAKAGATESGAVKAVIVDGEGAVVTAETGAAATKATSGVAGTAAAGKLATYEAKLTKLVGERDALAALVDRTRADALAAGIKLPKTLDLEKRLISLEKQITKVEGQISTAKGATAP